MTRKDLAERTNINKNTLSNWGKDNPTVQVETLARAAKVLDVDVTDLLGPLAPLGSSATSSLADLEDDLRTLEPVLRVLAGAPDVMGALAESQQRAATIRSGFEPWAAAAQRLLDRGQGDNSPPSPDDRDKSTV